MPDHENILTPPLMLVRYAGMASLLTTVWESRRKLQDRIAVLEGRVEDTKILMGRHVEALYERIYGQQKRHEEELARTRVELEAQRDSARAQFGVLFDALVELGASFSTEQGKVVAVSMPEAQVRS
jgi:hypothetical protein